MPNCDRAERYIEFKPNSNDDNSVEIIMAMDIGQSTTRLTRVATHPTGLVSTLTAVFSDMGEALTAIETIPVRRQLEQNDSAVIARSYLLQSKDASYSGAEELTLRYACALVGGLELRVDATTGGSYPAEVQLLSEGKPVTYLPNTLADGSDAPSQHRAARTTPQPGSTSRSLVTVANIPDDLLAILGPQWRPLVNQGDHWKGLMRSLGKGDKRTQACEHYITQAIEHLQSTLSQEPSAYHLQHHKARWRVYFRRLRPVLVFTGLMAAMLVSWLLLKDAGLNIHPLTQGLTPLLMVGVLALTAREIPVMEIPARPAPLSDSYWTSQVLEHSTADTSGHANSESATP